MSRKGLHGIQGSIIPRHLPFTSSNHIIKTFRHAIALDERRSKFNVNTWQKQLVADSKPLHHIGRRQTWYEMARRDSATYGRGETDVLEVWFSGTHADVGGGECKDDRVHSLSNISLRWMIREIARSQCGILFDTSKLRGMGIPRSLFRVTAAFDRFKASDPDNFDFFGDQIPQTSVKFVDEPGTISGGDTTPLIPKSAGGNDKSGLTRRWTVAPSLTASKSRSSRSHSRSPSIVFPTFGMVRSLTTGVFFPGVVLPPEEPNEHTFEDHFKMEIEELDEEDAVEPLHDELMLQKSWLILELLPMKRVWQERGKWRSTFWPNFGRARRIPAHPPPNIHHTVLLRQSKLGYRPKAQIPEIYNVIQ
ncbi:hypothetical protein FS842_009121 [Serendipita sp. 407]|nr:hypothetical protein FRC15_003000 [Serendipita sp. 397]KAG9052868.1 hypothetical protein FS842_009121 [Serendipita sp. 407]